jgi:asparagine synthase (glutamine-hydrolysing)
MPGIVGLITGIPRPRAEAQLKKMLEAIRHDSSHAVGSWSDESAGVYLGWVARSGSFAGQMPIRNEQGDKMLVFSGEEFPDADVRAGLRAAGHTVCEEGPSYLVHLAECHDNFPYQLNGRFHGLLLDRVNGVAKLFNDRYGMHRVYYSETNDAFYFAAEAKAILAARPESRALVAANLAEFISCGCVLENKTIFRNIHVLPPASAWIFRNRALQQKTAYFNPSEWEEQPVLDEEIYYRNLRDVVARKVPAYFVGPEKIGISLTGGLDSRIILAWHKAEPGSMPCYSFGGPYRDSQDVLMARKIARMCGQPHQTIRVAGEFLSTFPQYAERTVYLTDGCLEVKHSPDLYINEQAANIAPIRMTGNYGGEVLRRVRAFKPVEPVPGLFHPDLSADLAQAKQTYGGLLQVHPLSFAVFRQAPWHHYGLLSLEQSQLSLRSPYLDNDLVKTVFQAPQSTLTGNDISLRLIQDGDPELRRIRTDLGAGGSLPSVLAELQRKYLEFTFKSEYAYDYGMPQAVARVDHALAPFHLERLFLGRHKFYHFRVWYRDALAGYVREMLLDPCTLSRPWWQKNRLQEVVHDHLSGKRNYTTAIHKILTLELVQRLFVDSR